ncbi:amidase signature domain-containing protein [Aspergillus pseudoustus]|uniref:amidase n=1 Tax=Aspergillus pseudoustus TaxID=1810923 RepID=A0ABR4J355_9EURO
MSWEEIAEKKRQALKNSIPSQWIIPDDLLPPADQADVTTFPRESGFFTERELELTSTNATDLLKKLASGEWTSTEITTAFCKTAAVAHQLTNCLSEAFFPLAISRAQELDEYLKVHGKPKGPFHGLPISIKDNFNYKGFDSTVGFASLVNEPATYNSTLVDLLLSAGAILYCKTNVPTAMMIAESVNNVYGRTVNPRNRSLTSGGSSGGESALIAFGGSRIGVGTDIGGSLRIPAACTGIFTIRPSFGRFPNSMTRSGLAGQEAVLSVNGPMAKTLEEVVLWASTVVGQAPWLTDPKCLPIPWRKVSPKGKLKIAVLYNDGIVTPTPPVSRALNETAEKLKRAGHEIVTWAPTEHKDLLGTLSRMFVADGGKSVQKLLEPTGEPFRPEMQAYADATELGVYDMWQLQLKRNELCKSYLDRWNAAGIDAVLCPVTPYSTVEHGKFAYVGYTGVFNVLDYPAVSFPCGVTTDKDIDAPYPEHKPLSDTDAQIQRDYSAEPVQGMPVNLQLVGRRLEDENVLAMTEVILKAVASS